eukprot:Skav208590  [mRNA]  locus=scaffold3152:313046:316194:- [translate_table: standard]
MSNPAIGSEDSSDDFHELVPELALRVSNMAITHPEVLRVTRAYQTFQNCSEAFRKPNQDLYHKSRKSENISRFWSHSWHGSARAKVLTLLFLYNGLASVLLGTFAALVMAYFFSLGVLPGFERRADGMQWSAWGLVMGLVVSVASFVFWKPRQDVFFDGVCISNDPDVKCHAIVSLAGMLQNSKEMLVLWDPSWGERLWCLFELAAFLKCKKAEGSRKVLIIRPTLVGPCSIVVFLTSWAAMLPLATMPLSQRGPLGFLTPVIGMLVTSSVAGYCALVTFRAYFHSVQVLEETLRWTTFDTVRSSCCERNHVDRHGYRMLCDREFVKQCVTLWFGSTQAFEETIRSELLDVVTEELRYNIFTQGWVLQVSTPILWGFMDNGASHIRDRNWDYAFTAAIMAVFLWLFFAPMLLEATILLTRHYCARATCCGSIFADFLLKLALLLVLVLVAALMIATLVVIEYVFDGRSESIRAVAQFGAFLILYIIKGALKSVYLMWTRWKRKRSSPSTAPKHKAEREVIEGHTFKGVASQKNAATLTQSLQELLETPFQTAQWAESTRSRVLREAKSS